MRELMMARSKLQYNNSTRVGVPDLVATIVSVERQIEAIQQKELKSSNTTIVQCNLNSILSFQVYEKRIVIIML